MMLLIRLYFKFFYYLSFREFQIVKNSIVVCDRKMEMVMKMKIDDAKNENDLMILCDLR